MPYVTKSTGFKTTFIKIYKIVVTNRCACRRRKRLGKRERTRKEGMGQKDGRSKEKR